MHKANATGISHSTRIYCTEWVDYHAVYSNVTYKERRCISLNCS